MVVAILQEQLNNEKIFHSSPSEDIILDPLFLPWKSLIKVIEDSDIAPYESFDAPLIYEYEWDLPISPNGNLFPIFPPLTSFKSNNEPLYDERKRL